MITLDIIWTLFGPRNLRHCVLKLFFRVSNSYRIRVDDTLDSNSAIALRHGVNL